MVTQLGTRVDPAAQEIRVDGESLSLGRRVYYAVNKPKGVVTTNRDPGRRPRVIDLVPNQDIRLVCHRQARLEQRRIDSGHQ